MTLAFAVPPPVGIAFDIPELVLLRAWAARNRLRLKIVLDRVRSGEQYEEVALLYPEGASEPSLVFWRTAEVVILERTKARPQRFRFLSDALEAAASAGAEAERGTR